MLETKRFHCLSRHDFIGSAELIVGDLVTAEGQKLVMAIQDRNGEPLPKSKGSQPMVIVRAQEIGDNLDEIELELSSKGLPRNKSCFGSIGLVSLVPRIHMAETQTPKWQIIIIRRSLLPDLQKDGRCALGFSVSI